MKRNSIIILLLAVTTTFSQPSGKIAGYVVDSESNEPLTGVNISVQNEKLGAATDTNGKFVILGINPGDHTLVFEYIGYRTVTVEEVIVKIDRTTRVNIVMEQAMMELDEVVVVTAERPIVESDKTFSSVHLEAVDVTPLPVEGVRNILELSAGINKNPDGTLSIRGGGSYEINYQINGIKSLNTNTGIPAYGTGTKSENSWKFDINPHAIAQMEVISGGFNAEYGNAQSGVVKVVTKEGGPDFTGSFFAEYRPPGKYHWGDYVYSRDQYEWQKWGELERWYTYVSQQEDLFRNESGQIDSAVVEHNYNLWITNHSPSNDNLMGVYDYRDNPYTRYSFTFGGPLGRRENNVSFFFAGEIKNKPTRLPTAEKIHELNNYSLVLAYRPNPRHKLKLTGLYQSFNSGMGSGSDDIRWAGLWGSTGAKRKYTLVYDTPREETVFSQSLDYKYVHSARTFLDISLTHQKETLFARQIPTPSDATDVIQANGDWFARRLEALGPWFEDYTPYYTWSSLYNQASLSEYLESKINFSSQVNDENLLKIGAEGWILDQDFNASSSSTVSAYIWRTGFATNYNAKTWYAAGYIQDKIEFSGMVGNYGIRFDAYNYGEEVPEDKYAVFYPGEGADDQGIPKWNDSKTFTSVSPRLGFSFPIGEKTAFRAQYGHFRSMPILNRALDHQSYNGWGSYGNPNLKPQLSINYEVGVQQNLWDTHQLDVVTYYNDLEDQVSLVYIMATSGSWSSTNPPDDLNDLRNSLGLIPYQSYRNNGYGTSRGVEITFANKDYSNWRYRLSYSLKQTTYGNHGSIVDSDTLAEFLQQKYQFSATDFIAPEDRTHRFNGSLTYFWREKEGPAVFGINLLENSTISVIYRVSSGLSYFFSREYQTDFQLESNRRYPMESQTDLRFEKTFNFEKFTFHTSIRVQNLFDNKHLTPFSSSTELERWVLRGVTYMDADYADPVNDPVRPVRIYNYFQAFKNIPRQVFISAGFTF